MIVPIVAYGDPVLKKVAVEIDKSYAELPQMIENLFQTMYHANGVGLAAPQIGKSIRMFVVDGTAIEALQQSNFKKVFINPTILEEHGEEWAYEEGCLSIPTIRENVFRQPKVRLKYFNEKFEEFDEIYEGMQARIIQHEYDHLEGVLFVDYLSSLKKQLIRNKLSNISKGRVEADYKMKFPQAPKGR